ncbi:MAG TPA: hypothetical protein VF175_15945 [Lacipirellula sp.]
MKTIRFVLFSLRWAFALALLGILAARSGAAWAAVIYESAALGPTGVSQGSVPGTNINPFVFTGVRFELLQPAITSQVGGHFTSPANGTFFGALVRLDSAEDFPNSASLSTADVLGAAVLDFPLPSAEVYGELSLSLSPGWYALVFGSGLFTSSGYGSAPRNNMDFGEPDYIAFQPGIGWFDLTDLSDVLDFVDHRFVVLGSIVPEPSTAAILVLGMAILFAQAKSRR